MQTCNGKTYKNHVCSEESVVAKSLRVCGSNFITSTCCGFVIELVIHRSIGLDL